MSLDLAKIRARFPALQREVVYLDNPGGTQVAQSVLDRMNTYLAHHNANHGGQFATSIESDAVLAEARQAAADFLHASRPEEIVFGPNMTSLTFQISRSLAHWLQPGDEIAVTRLDHDANITPWARIAEERGCTLRWVDFRPEDGTLDPDSLQTALEHKPRILAFGFASNALGTINHVEEITQQAHEAGALVYIDAVQYAPHGPIDVQALDCDFLVCSAYKFFGPHVGLLYGKYQHLAELPAYRVRPAPADPPGKFETGTQNHEGLAGMLGALEYLTWVGENWGEQYGEKFNGRYQGRALQLKQAMVAIRSYEFELSRLLLDILEEIPGVTVYGLTDQRRLEERVPTFAFRLGDRPPADIARALAQAGFNVWDGNYYALAVTERLEVEDKGGMVRVGPVHYNTLEELQGFGKALSEIAGR